MLILSLGLGHLFVALTILTFFTSVPSMQPGNLTCFT